jgi:hypothetical protein
MSEPQLQPPPSGLPALVLGFLGALLLLPGLCSLFFMLNLTIGGPPELARFVRTIAWVSWALSFIVGAFGIVLIRLAIRRARRG